MIISACVACAFALGGCNQTPAEVQYTLAEDGTHYIVSGVSGNKNSLKEYEILSKYSAEEGGQALPVTEIGERAFMQCSSLTSIKIPDSVTKIGRNAFVQCALLQIEIPESVETIGYGAFGMCRSLTEITVPYGVKELGPLAFFCCSSVETVYVKSQTEIINERVFYNSYSTVGGNMFTDTSLKNVYLSKTIKKIHRDAFAGNAITDFYFEGSEEEWKNVNFCYFELKEGKEDEYEEKIADKEQLMGNITVHYNVQF